MSPFTEIVKKILSADLTDGAKLAALAYEIGAQNAREASEVCNKSIRTMERHYADMRVWREKHRRFAEDAEKTPQICGGGYADLRTDDIAPACENNSARDCKESPTEISSIPQQQQASDPIESGLLSLLRSEWNLYTDAEAKTSLLGQFRTYGEKNVLDAYSSYLAESKSGREFVKPWKYIQKTASNLRDAPPPSANVVPMPSRFQTSNSRIRARMKAEIEAMEAQV